MFETSPIAELLEFDYSSFPAKACTIPDHLHHFYQLDVILSGQVTVRIEGRRPLLGKTGDAWLIPPLIRHGYIIRKPFRQASFKFHLAPQYWNLLGKRFTRQHIFPELLAMAESAGMRHRDQSSMTITQAVAVATLCLIEFTDHGPTSTDYADSLDSFRSSLWPLLEQVLETPHDGWTVSKMAKASHLSTDHFSRCFHGVLGQTPKSYILECKIRSAASALLADPSRPIKDIAEDANYATVHAFSRAFRQVIGNAPAAYRRARHPL